MFGFRSKKNKETTNPFLGEENRDDSLYDQDDDLFSDTPTTMEDHVDPHVDTIIATEVKVGQIYSDNDTRSPRVIRVLSIEGDGLTGKAKVQTLVMHRKTFISCVRLLKTNRRGFTYEGMSK
jgi:hypothetical protein